MKSRRFALALAFCLSIFASAQATKLPAAAEKIPTRTFVDAANGISFKYPAAWTMSHEPSFYLAPLISLPKQSAQTIVFFSPSGDSLNTNLGGLEFTYVSLPQPSQTSCLQRITKDMPPESTPPDTVTINGTKFLHISTEDAGLCHQARRNIYETYRHGSCFLFEAAFYTICPDPDDSKAELTPAQSQALSRSLNAIIQTVTISPVK
jgi:hypothetical protein